jgi:hypothetical protein
MLSSSIMSPSSFTLSTVNVFACGGGGISWALMRLQFKNRSTTPAIADNVFIRPPEFFNYVFVLCQALRPDFGVLKRSCHAVAYWRRRELQLCFRRNSFRRLKTGKLCVPERKAAAVAAALHII